MERRGSDGKHDFSSLFLFLVSNLHSLSDPEPSNRPVLSHTRVTGRANGSTTSLAKLFSSSSIHISLFAIQVTGFNSSNTNNGSITMASSSSAMDVPALAQDHSISETRFKIALSLYKVQQNIYLLDFQRVEGGALGFMKLCALIIAELKNLSAANRAMQIQAQGLPVPPPR